MAKPIAEWWELWWKKPRSRPVMLPGAYGEPVNPHIPRGGFPTLAEAKAAKKKEKNKYHVIVHIRRFRVRSRYSWYRKNPKFDGYEWWHGHDWEKEGFKPFWHLRGDNSTIYKSYAEAMKNKPPTPSNMPAKLHTFRRRVRPR